MTSHSRTRQWPGSQPRRASLYGRRVARRRFGPGRRIGLLTSLLLVLLSVAALGTFAYSDRLTRNLDPIPLPADTLVYDRAGSLIADVHAGGATRIPVPLAAIAPPVQQAIVAVEDRNFWSEGSVDWRRVAAAAAYDVAHRNADQGASTITEQLAKVLYLDDHKTLERKANEMLIGAAIASRSSKADVLDEYLNDVYFGHGATGIEAASRVYFGRAANQLDLAQASLLAGLPNAPSELDPLVNPAGAAARQQVVLASMVTSGVITEEQATAASQEKLVYADGSSDNVNAYPDFDARVAAQLQATLHVNPATAGLTVRTTLDPQLQTTAVKAVHDHVLADRRQHATDGAAVSVDPATGEVLAYVGDAGPQAPGNQIDMAAQPRQPGSTMKIFTYSEAIAERKVTETTPICDCPLTLPNGGTPYTVHDYSGGYLGVLPLRAALGNSLNIPAVRVEQTVGQPAVVNVARSLGVTALGQDPASYGPSLTLGAYPVPLWETAQAYTALADGGIYHPVTFVTSAKDSSGRELLPAPAPGRQALDPGVAFIMNDILSTDRNRAIEFGLGSDLTVSGHRVASKTGTTNDNKDALTVGWTPRLLTAVWVGNTDDSPMNGVVGALGAAPIWHQIEASGLASGDSWPSPPDDVYSMWSGGAQAWYLNGTEQSDLLPLGGSGSSPTPPARRA
ncbi:MAG: transglycosylase domain-containing protein [Candidatus Dormibacteraeota bacterium]|nr:transglycosylase domain-containing protein [Candidatus Dormibacteraeota bacterium]